MMNSMKTLDDYVSEMNVLNSKSACSILNIANLFISAKKELNQFDYSKFINRIHYTDKSSSIRKWEAIGHASLRLMQVAHLLPPNWSTIYKISALTPEEFDYLIKNNLLNPSITAIEINQQLELKANNQKLNSLFLKVEFDGQLDRAFIREKVDEIKAQADSVFIKLTENSELKKLLKEAEANNENINEGEEYECN